MSRAYNFSAGPATLPEPVLRRRRRRCSTGTAPARRSSSSAIAARSSSRSPPRPKPTCARCCRSPTTTRCCSSPAARPPQQALIPLNFAAPGQAADYVVTGHWGKTALKQAKPYVAAQRRRQQRGRRLPRHPRARRLAAVAPMRPTCTITANETIHGVEFRDIPDVGDVPLVADFSSSIASEPLDVREVRDHLRRRAEEPRARSASAWSSCAATCSNAPASRARTSSTTARTLKGESMLNTPPTLELVPARA